MRIGSDRTVDVDVRIIAATNQDLLAKVEEGTFRKDLYYRLSVIPIVIPPLRQRKEDVELLIRHFAGDRFDELWKDGARVLQGYDWPGNVRELENAITFYKVFGALPIGNEEGEGRQQSVPDGRADKEQSLRTMRRAILMCLNENAKRVKGTGRPEMLQAIRDQGIMASDGRLRQILGEMEEEGLLQISRGRRGTVITEKGIDTLFEEYLA
jgi:transcriptional regulator with GAF, ATPase, and Fis domain